MRMILLLVSATLFVTSIAHAEDFPSQITQGQVEVLGEAGVDPDADPTLSLGLFRVDNDVRVFCDNIDAEGFVSGMTDPIVRQPEPIFLQLFSFSEAACTGNISDSGSADRYEVMWGNPAQPFLRLVTP